MTSPARGVLRRLLVISFFTVLSTSLAEDTLDRSRSIRPGDSLVSAGDTFELGFFSPGGSGKWYVGIWFKNVPVGNVVWVANRRAPLNDSTGVLKLGNTGNLVIQGRAGGIVWESSSAASGVTNPVAQLLETGNLVIRGGDGNAANAPYIWQSFDEPGNTLLAGMRLGVSRRSRLSWQLTSWRSADDPSPGNYTFGLDAKIVPHLVLLRQGSTVVYSSGPWNGLRFSGIPDSIIHDIYKNVFVSDQDAIYYSFETAGRNSTYSTVVVQHSGIVQRLVWSPRTSTWNVIFTVPVDECDDFAACGPFGICNVNASPMCQCPRGFQPRSPQDWYLGETSGGCVRCGGGDGFLRLQQVKLPDAGNATVHASAGLDECRDRCLRNCSCAAYARGAVGQGISGCITWSGETVDVRIVANGPEELYVRVPAAALDAPASDDTREDKRKPSRETVVATSVASGTLLLSLLCGCGVWMKKRREKKRATTKTTPTARGDAPAGDTRENKRKPSTVTVVTTSVASGTLLVSLVCGCGVWMKKRREKKRAMTKTTPTARGDGRATGGRIVGEDAELPLLDFETIAMATDNFSLGNRVGEGGFGAVYKGVLDDGQEVAVKRLSWISTQGTSEFMNEAKLIAKLQHKNLVRLLGCCIQGEERMLIYEYMQNKSLDHFIFDKSKRALLDWRTRLDIILGVAKGLMYLHHDSRYKIIHRDLKASNILLDGAMNPKISDFGTARIFGADQNVEKTKRVIGTFGYMSPEYAINGAISVKSDVFSFGVLTLEMLSGAKNRGCYEDEPHLNLLSYAWKLWQEGKCLEFLDLEMTNSCDRVQFERCIQVALLCVQEHATDRPTMSTVVTMLVSENFPLPQPKRPGFLVLSSSSLGGAPCSKQEFTEIDMTITTVDGR